MRTALLLAVLSGVLLPTGAIGKDKDCKSNQDCALDAREQGKIHSLSEVLAATRSVAAGEVVKVELDREDGIWVYKMKVLLPSGRRREVEVNAETLAIMKVD